MILTQRGRRLIAAIVLVGSFAAGMTAQVWDPYTRQLDSVSVQLAPGVKEDQAVCFGAREISYEPTSDGVLVMRRAVEVLDVRS